MRADTRPKNGAWAPGNYECICVNCRDSFIGDKRAMACAECAYNNGWRLIERWDRDKHGPHVLGFHAGRYGVAEYRYFHEGGWQVASFNGQVIKQIPEMWRPLPTPPPATNSAASQNG